MPAPITSQPPMSMPAPLAEPRIARPAAKTRLEPASTCRPPKRSINRSASGPSAAARSNPAENPTNTYRADAQLGGHRIREHCRQVIRRAVGERLCAAQRGDDTNRIRGQGANVCPYVRTFRTLTPNSGQLPISPPSAFVIASTALRGGRSLRGQRACRRSSRPRVLDREEERPAVRCELGTADLGADRPGEETARRAAIGPLVAAAYRLSLKPAASSWPSVEIQMRSFGSNATLSGAHTQPLAVTGAA